MRLPTLPRILKWVANRPAARKRSARALPRLEQLEDRLVPSTIQGTVFHDTNANGTLDPGESGLSGWTGYLDINKNSVLDSGEPATTTDAAGHYTFDTTNVTPMYEDANGKRDYVRLDLQTGSELGGRWLNTTATLARANRTTTPDATANFGVFFQPNVGAAPVGPESLVNVTTDGLQATDSGNGTNVSVSADAAGNYVVAWRTFVGGGTDTIYARVFNADGSARTGEITVGTGNSTGVYGPDPDFSMPKVAVAGNGAFAVSWSSLDDPVHQRNSVFARVYKPDATPAAPTVTLVAASSTTRGGLQGVAADAGGDFVVLYKVETLKGGFWTGPTIKAQRYTSAGTANGSAISVVGPSLVNGHANVAMAGAGNFVVVWDEIVSPRSGKEAAYVYAQRYTASGKATGSQITVVTGSGGSAVAMNSAGQFVVVWSGGAQQFNADGTRSGPTVAGITGVEGVAIDGARNVTFVWTSNMDASSIYYTGEVRMRRLPAGALVPEPETLVNTTTQGAQSLPGVAATGNGSFVVAWEGYGPGDDAGIFTQRYATTSPLVASAAGSGGAVLSADDLQPILDEAIARWERTGLTAEQLDLLRSVSVQIADLGGTTLGEASGTTIVIDDDAAGWGWFVDSTPSSDSEFRKPGDQGEQNHMDLLTVVMHEMGHILGLDHDTVGVMQEALDAGTRWTPTAATIDGFFATH